MRELYLSNLQTFFFEGQYLISING